MALGARVQEIIRAVLSEMGGLWHRLVAGEIQVC
jgi:hypothetical protein